MINLLFLALSFFPINDNYHNKLEVYSEIFEDDCTENNNIKYNFKIDKAINSNKLKIESQTQNFSGTYKYKLLYTNINYESSSYNSSYKDKLKLKNNKYINRAKINLGVDLNKLLVKGIFHLNFNSDLENIFQYGLYLGYKVNNKNFNYHIYLSKYEIQEASQNIVENKNNLYNFPKKYSSWHTDLNLELEINNLIKVKIKKKLINSESLVNSKEGFSFDESGKSNKYSIETSLKFKTYSFVFKYKETDLIGESKGQLDNVKFSKFIIKDFHDKIYSIDFILKDITNLGFGFLYQSFNSYYYGNIEAWPFPEYDKNWTGGRVNLSSKPKYNRFVLRLRNQFSFLKNKIKLKPSLYYDKIVIKPNTNTYEAGILGFGKQKERVYDKEIIANLLKLTLLLEVNIDNFNMALALAQIIPISIDNKNLENSKKTSPSLGSNTQNKFFLDKPQGFSVNFSIIYSF